MTDPRSVLKKYWGYEEFRPLQEDIIQSVLQGRDTLALLPTGGGKSLCFQVPALCLDGLTLVISPLIALMKDQVFRLRQLNIPAAAIYSGMHAREIERLLDNAQFGSLKLLYISPERLSSDWAATRIRQMPVKLLAVDEAHCISQWGYDFRPSYMQIPQLREWHPDIPILALTATATAEVVEDIQQRLTFRQGRVLQKSFKRDNLAYMVRPSEDKIHQMLRLLKRATGSAIVYVDTRKATREMADILRRHGLSADHYHAGLDPEERHRKQEEWMLGKTRIIVSTNAFGMGIDKGNVRLVLHLYLPESLEAYFQEAGRAGRDGQKAWAILLYHPVDSRILEDKYTQSFPELEEVRRVYRALGSYLQLPTGSGKGESFDFDLHEFCQRFGLPSLRTYHALQLLQQEGLLDLSDSIRTQAVLHFKVNAEQLYDYQLRNPALDPLIKTILRQYHGALSQPVYLKEQKLARFLKLSITRLQQLLQQLHRENIAIYTPHKDKPQLTFLTERLPAENLQFDLAKYKFRKERFRYRIDQSMAYATEERCRSQFLLEYFGEKDAPLCGICDYCVAKTSKESQVLLRQQLKTLIQDTRPELQELLDHFPPELLSQYRVVLDNFMQEKQVVLEGNKLVWKT